MSVPLNTRQWGQRSGFGVVKNVPVEKLEFSQANLDDEKVDRMAQSSQKDWDVPVGAEIGDRVVVEDGHHRAAARIKRGNKYVPVRVF